MTPTTVSALVRARRVPAYGPADIEQQIARIDALRRQHKSVDAELATLRLMRAAQLVPAARAAKQQRRAS